MSQLEQSHLDRLGPSINRGLEAYRNLARVTWKPELAATLRLTPEKPYSAKGTTDLLTLDFKKIGDLVVIALQPEDGTGAEIEGREVDELYFSAPYLPLRSLVPRDKIGVHHEVMVPVLSEDSHGNVAIFPDNTHALDLVGLNGFTVEKIGSLNVHGPTYTVGWKDGERFGDPHAIHNPSDRLHMVAFMAITNAIAEEHPNILQDGFAPSFPG